MTGSLRSMVIFLIVLAVAATAVAGGYYFAAGHTVQKTASPQPPENTLQTKCKNCELMCRQDYPADQYWRCWDDYCVLLC